MVQVSDQLQVVACLANHSGRVLHAHLAVESNKWVNHSSNQFRQEDSVPDNNRKEATIEVKVGSVKASNLTKVLAADNKTTLRVDRTQEDLDQDR